MNLEKLTWYAARSGGIVAWVLLAAGLILGLLLSSRVLGRRASPAWILSVHRFLGGLSVVFTAVHVVAIMLDNFVAFGLMDVLVPWASEWKPTAVAWGVIAMYLMVSIELTSFAMKRLPRSVWRAVHWSSAPLFVVATMHGWQAGTDAGRAFMSAIVATTVVLAVLTVVRVVMARRRPAARDPRALLDEANARRNQLRGDHGVTADHGTAALLAEAALASDRGSEEVTTSWLPEPEPAVADTPPATLGWFADDQGARDEPADDTEEEPVFGSFFATAPDAPPAELSVEPASLPAPAFAQQAPPTTAPPEAPTPAPTPPTFGQPSPAAPARQNPETTPHSPQASTRNRTPAPARLRPEATSPPSPAFGQPRPPTAAPPKPPSNPWGDHTPANGTTTPGPPTAGVDTAAPMPGWLDPADDTVGTTPEPGLNPVSQRREGPVPGVWKRTLDPADR